LQAKLLREAKLRYWQEQQAEKEARRKAAARSGAPPTSGDGKPFDDDGNPMQAEFSSGFWENGGSGGSGGGSGTGSCSGSSSSSSSNGAYGGGRRNESGDGIPGHGRVTGSRPHWKSADPFVVLKLSKGTALGGSAAADARRAYRRLCLLYHPDKNSHPEATGAFLAITDAYRAIAYNA